MAVFAVTAMLFGFVAAHSFWRFCLRQQLPSLVHTALPVLVFVYAGSEFQDRTVQLTPSLLAWVTGGVGLVCFALIVRHELKQQNPWN